MKKMLLAASVTAAMAAGSVNAATIYDNKGLTYKLKGDFQIQLRKDMGDDQDTDVEFDDLELKNSVIYDLGNGMKAFAQLDFGFKDAADKSSVDSPELEEAYLGMDFGNVSVSVGKMDNAADEFGVEQAIEISDEDMFDAEGSTDGDDVIRLDAEFDAVTVVLSTEIHAESEKSDDNGESTELFVAADLGAVELGLAWQNYDEDPNSDGDVDVWGVSAAGKVGSVKLMADFSSADNGSEDADLWNLAAAFPVAATTKLTVGYQNIDDGSDDESTWYANVVYKFPTQKNVRLFAEVMDSDADDTDMGFLAGMRIKF